MDPFWFNAYLFSANYWISRLHWPLISCHGALVALYLDFFFVDSWSFKLHVMMRMTFLILWLKEKAWLQAVLHVLLPFDVLRSSSCLTPVLVFCSVPDRLMYRNYEPMLESILCLLRGQYFFFYYVTYIWNWWRYVVYRTAIIYNIPALESRWYRSQQLWIW